MTSPHRKGMHVAAFLDAARQPVLGRFIIYGLAVIVACGLLMPPARAQGDASLSGYILDGTGGTVPGAAVKIRNLETGAEHDVVSDQDGRFSAVSLPVGNYSVSVTKEGFRAETRAGILLTVGQRGEVDIVLQLGDVHQTIEVPAVSGALAITTEDSSGLVGEREIKELPLNGRSYDQLLTLNPGIVNYTSQRAGGIGTSNSVVGNMFAVSGRRPQENLYLLNGVEFTSASEINNTPGGVSGQLLGVDAVREFSAVKDTYGAEYGKRPGAQVSIVTTSGSNQFHGAAYEFLRNSAFDARNFFDFGSIPQFHRNVFGASLGGPLRREKSFFFGNYESFRQHLGLSDLTLVPDDASRASAVATIQPLLALWPIANGPELLTSTGARSGVAEAFSNPMQRIREDFGTTRFDQMLSTADSFSAVYTIDDGASHSPTSNPNSFADVFLREQVASLSETRAFSATLVNKGTFGFSRGAFYFDSGTIVNLPGWIHPGQPVGAVIVGGGTTLNGASQLTNGGTNGGSNLTVVRNLFTVTDQLNYTHGRHSASFGFWLQRLQSNDALVQNQYGQISFSSLKSFLQGAVSTYTFAPSSTPLGWRSLEAAVYAEDAIKLKPSLELRIGFRGESTNGWNEALGRASNHLFDANGFVLTQPTVGSSVFTVNNAKFLPAPRIGLAWSPFASKKTLIRAGFGLYYALNDALNYRLDQIGPFNTVYTVKNIPFSEIAPGAAYSGAKVVPSGVQSDLQTPVVESYKLKIEQQLPGNVTLGVTYIGSHAYHEILSIDANVPIPTICPASPCPVGYPAGTWYNPTGAPQANNAVSNTTHWFSEGVSSYHGLEVDVDRHFAKRLQLRATYTYSKALDDGDSLNTSVATNSPAFASNPLRPKWDYGPGSFDVRHAAVIHGTYDLPFASRNRAGSGGWLAWIFGDWQISGIQTLQAGLPFTPQLSYNPSNDGDSRNPVRPSLNPNFIGRLILGGTDRYFNPTFFTPPLPGTYGNAGRNILRGPGIVETDVSLAKRLAFSERLNLQLRAEVFNLLNHTNFNNPNPVVFTSPTEGPSPTAGVITATSTTSRQVQLGLKLVW